MRIILAIAMLISVAGAPSAAAYIGPGLGLGTIGVVLGILLSLVLAAIAVFWYPIKRMLGLGKNKRAEKRRNDSQQQSDE